MAFNKQESFSNSMSSSNSSYVSSCSSGEVFSNFVTTQRHQEIKDRLNAYEVHDTPNLLHSLHYSIFHMPLSTMILHLRRFIQSPYSRGHVVRICISSAIEGRSATYYNFSHDPTSREIMGIAEFRTPFGFSEIPYALIGHLIIASGKLVALDRNQLHKLFAGKPNIWEILPSSDNTEEQEELRQLAQMRPVNLKYAKKFSDKLHQPGPLDDFDFQTLVDLSIKLECPKSNYQWP